MIPDDWRPHRRLDDGELVGYLVGEEDTVVPMTLLGTSAGESQTAESAGLLLDERGLAILNERWWCRLPSPASTSTDPTHPQADWTWRAILVIEANPAGCTIRIEYPTVEEFMLRLWMPVPAGKLLVKTPPE